MATAQEKAAKAERDRRAKNLANFATHKAGGTRADAKQLAKQLKKK